MRLMIEQRQSLQMVMTTELRQAIELLQLSTYDLMKFIEKQAEENPFIELVESDISYTRNSTPSFTKLDNEETDPLDFVVEEKKCLYNHLLEQVNVLPISEKQHKILRFLVLNLDEQGFLQIEEEEVASFLHVKEESVLEAKEILQRLEPIGIGVKNIKESLYIQAQHKYPQDKLLHEVILNYLQQLADRRWSNIATALSITTKDIETIFKKVQTLQPKPTLNFTTSTTKYIVPDLYVHYNEDSNHFEVKLNNYYVPDIKFNSEYVKNLHQTSEVADYINKHYQKYNWLRKSIEQRRTTILKIMDVVLKHQREFFKHGFRSLRPLTLKDVAEEIGMHESTVSRATANKFIETTNGTIELRQLFSTSLSTKTGSNASQTKVKELLKELVDQEDKSKPLSDQKIATELKEQNGIVISRRTVAKYRQELHIPSSVQRRNT